MSGATRPKPPGCTQSGASRGTAAKSGFVGPLGLHTGLPLGLPQVLGSPRQAGIFRSVFDRGENVGWIFRLVKIGTEGEGRSRDVMGIERSDDIADLGLTLSETKHLLAMPRQEIVAAQVRDHAVRRPTCSRCGGGCRVKDYQDHVVATLFGQVTMRLPRFRCAACCESESGIDWPSHCRSTPELDRLQAHLAALMTCRTAADLLERIFPVDAAKHPETVRRHALKVGEALRECATARPEVAASAAVVTLDSTFIRSCGFCHPSRQDRLA
jgi:hypothetical protein